MSKLKNIHPGEVLKEEFLDPLGISAYRLSKDTFIPQTRISEILKGRRRVTADSALRFAKYFGTSAKFWLGLQDDYDLEEEGINKKSELDKHLKEIRIGTVSPIFKIVYQILNDDYKNLADNFKKAIIVDDLKIDHYLEWPIFDFVRESEPLHKELLETFK